MKIGLLASGDLGFQIVKQMIEKREIIFVMTDRGSLALIELCDYFKLPVFVGNPRAGKVQPFIKDKPIDVLVSVNYLFLIEKDLIKHPSILAFNIHGSLLPKYRGRTPHVWAIINNETKTGITAHVIDEGCDTGAVIEQIVVPIGHEDTGADLLKKFADNYLPLIERVLWRVEKMDLNFKIQDFMKASYFGKRSPEDGKIDWSWQKDRIRNWVRAQSYPYPGAFTYLDKQKITIDEVKLNSGAFDYLMPNGMILSESPFLVKTPNGVLEISKIRNDGLQLKPGKILE